MQTEKEQVQGQAPNLIIRGGGGPSLLRPMAKRFLANGHGPKCAYIFFIVSLAWSCDETNLQLLLRKKMFKKSEDFSQISGTFPFHSAKKCFCLIGL